MIDMKDITEHLKLCGYVQGYKPSIWIRKNPELPARNTQYITYTNVRRLK